MIQLASMKHLNDICKSKWSPWGRAAMRSFTFYLLIYFLSFLVLFLSSENCVIYECKNNLLINQIKYRLRKSILQGILYYCKSVWEKNFFSLRYLAHCLPLSFLELSNTIWLGNQFYLAFCLSSKIALFLYIKNYVSFLAYQLGLPNWNCKIKKGTIITR